MQIDTQEGQHVKAQDRQTQREDSCMKMEAECCYQELRNPWGYEKLGRASGDPTLETSERKNPLLTA